jgi:hypothetical protein
LQANQLKRLRDRDYVVHARRDRKRLNFMAPPAASDGRDNGALRTARHVRLKSGFADALHDVVDLLFGGAVGHIHNHGMTFSVSPQQKKRPRFASRPRAESLSWFLLLYWVAPILHLRRKTKPIAAKRAEVAESFHKICCTFACQIDLLKLRE